MPQIPLYGLQASPPPARPFQVTQTGAAAQAGQIDQAGELLMRRGAQLADEFDTVAATSAYNQWREEERSVLSNPKDGLLMSEGANAYGVQDRYKEFYDNSTGKVSTAVLKNQRQQAYFQRLVGTHRESSLNTLASHELQQHRALRKDSEQGLISNGIIDVRSNALNQSMDPQTGERPADRNIRMMKEGVVSLYGGFTNAAQLNEIEKQGRVAQIEQMIDEQAFGLADSELGKHKAVLGESYFTLKKRMENAGKETTMQNAFAAVQQQFGNNHEAALAYINQEKNWSKLGIGYDESVKLNARFSDMLSERERSRSIGENRMADNQRAKAAEVTADFLIGKGDRHNLPELIRNQVIPREVGVSLSAKKTGAKVDDWRAVQRVEEAIMRNEDVTPLLAELTSGEEPSIKDETAATLAKGAVNERFKRAKALVDAGTKPGEFDKWDADKNQKYYRAMNEFYSRLKNKEDYFAAAEATLQAFNNDMKSTVKNLPAPELLKGAKNDPAALDEAKAATIAARNSKGMEWYNREFKKIMKLEEVIERNAQVSNAQSELDKVLKARTGSK